MLLGLPAGHVVSQRQPELLISQLHWLMLLLLLLLAAECWQSCNSLQADRYLLVVADSSCTGLCLFVFFHDVLLLKGISSRTTFPLAGQVPLLTRSGGTNSSDCPRLAAKQDICSWTLELWLMLRREMFLGPKPATALPGTSCRRRRCLPDAAAAAAVPG